jgi:hypothetical protein
MKQFSFGVLYLGVALICSAALYSCQQDQINKNESAISAKSDPEAIVEFMGLKVRKPAGVAIDVLQLKTGEDVLKFLTNGSDAQARQGSEGTNIDKETFYKILGEVIAKYPKLNIEGYEKSALDRIYKDFPTLATEQDVLNNANAVATYYERLVTNDFQVELAKERSKSAGARRGDYTNNPYVNSLTSSYPVYGYQIEQASNEALAWTGEYFGNPSIQDNRGDCFRHCVWNVQSCCKMFRAGYNKWAVLGRVREFMTAFEQVAPSGTIPQTPSTTMDLHNNAFGRTYAMHATGNNIFDMATNVPHSDQIKSDFLYHVNNPSLMQIRTTVPDILALQGYDFNGLANTNYFGYYYAVALYY